MNAEKILLASASVCAVWLAMLMRRKGDRLGAIEHVLLALGLQTLRGYLSPTVGGIPAFCCNNWRACRLVWVKYSQPRGR